MAKQTSTNYLSIGEVAARAGVRTSALRYYESIGLLPAPRRINGRRAYEATILQQLAILQLAQKAGFTMNEIDELLHGFAADTFCDVLSFLGARARLANSGSERKYWESLAIAALYF